MLSVAVVPVPPLVREPEDRPPLPLRFWPFFGTVNVSAPPMVWPTFKYPVSGNGIHHPAVDGIAGIRPKLYPGKFRNKHRRCVYVITYVEFETFIIRPTYLAHHIRSIVRGTGCVKRTDADELVVYAPVGTHRSRYAPEPVYAARSTTRGPLHVFVAKGHVVSDTDGSIIPVRQNQRKAVAQRAVGRIVAHVHPVYVQCRGRNFIPHHPDGSVGHIHVAPKGPTTAWPGEGSGGGEKKCRRVGQRIRCHWRLCTNCCPYCQKADVERQVDEAGTAVVTQVECAPTGIRFHITGAAGQRRHGASPPGKTEVLPSMTPPGVRYGALQCSIGFLLLVFGAVNRRKLVWAMAIVPESRKTDSAGTKCFTGRYVSTYKAI